MCAPVVHARHTTLAEEIRISQPHLDVGGSMDYGFAAVDELRQGKFEASDVRDEARSECVHG